MAAWATIGILTVFLTFFVLRDGVQAWAWLLQATPARKRERIEASSRDALERVGGYLRGTAILSAALAVAYGAFLVLLGVPTPGLLAVVVFLGGFVPYLGNFVAMIVLLLVALSTVGPQTTLILLILMMVAHSLLNNLLRPVVYGRSVHLHPALVLIALPVGAAMAGIVGLFAAIPVTAVAVALGGATINALEPDPEAYPASRGVGMGGSPGPVELAVARRSGGRGGRSVRCGPGPARRDSDRARRRDRGDRRPPCREVAQSRVGWHAGRAGGDRRRVRSHPRRGHPGGRGARAADL